MPQQAFDDKLWMVGQKQVWSSKDGTTWTAQPKADWQERISFATVYFDNKLWMMGGLLYQPRTMANDIWVSNDGATWNKVVEHAEWPARKGHELVAFNNRLWLIGGASAVDADRAGKDFTNKKPSMWLPDSEPGTRN